MTDVCLIGQPYWTARLTELMRQYGDGAVRATDIRFGRGALVESLERVRSADLLLRVGYRPAALTTRGLAFDLLWSALRATNPSAQAVFYWVGTDVLRYCADQSRGRLTRIFHESLARDRHIAGAPWLTDELAAAGIRATTALFPHHIPEEDSPSPLPDRFTVMSYVNDRDYSFYGGETLYAAACALPGVTFDIVGGDGRWVREPLPNFRFFGWRNDLSSFYANTSVVIRLVPHDALGGTVREGLAYSRHIIYTYEVPFTHRVEFGSVDELVRVIGTLASDHDAGRLELNLAGRDYALRELSPSQNTRSLIAYLQGAAGR